MSYRYYITAKASPGFWGSKSKLPFEIRKIKSDEIIIISETGNEFDELIKLSNGYPDEVFRVTVAGEDIYENYVYLYEISKGDSKLVNEGFQYCFGIVKDDLTKLPEGLYEEFQKRVASYYKKLDQRRSNDVTLELSFDEKQDFIIDSDVQVSVVITYKSEKLRIKATKYSKTYIDVKVEFMDKPKDSIPAQLGHHDYYDNLPF